MKRRGKLILLSVSVIILLIIIFNFNEIKFGLNMAKSYNKDPQENSKDISQDKQDILKGDINPLIIILEKEGIHEDKDSEDISQEEDSKADKSEDKKTETNDKKESPYTDTIARYNSEFSSLQAEFESKLTSLMSEAYSEYKSGISAGKLAPKYLKKGAGLEAECDDKFYSMLDKLEDELKSAEQDTAVINDLKQYYNSYKDAKRGDILNKASGHL